MEEFSSSSSSSMAEKEETSADVAMDDILPILAASIASNSDLQEPSPEDAAWVDSCLEPNPYVPDHEWGRLSEALLETFAARVSNESAQVEPELPTEGRDDIEDDIEEAVSNDNVFKEDRDDDVEVDIEETESYDNIFKVANELIQQLKKADIGSQEECDDILKLEEDEENELIEGLKKTQIASQEEIESHDNIFKVWDLEWPEEDEESELIKQLKKALAGSKTGGQAAAAEELSSVDELVAGIGNLSLEQPSK